MNALGASRGGAALFWACAIACFVAACAALGASASHSATAVWARGLDGAVTVRIVAPDQRGATEAAAQLLRGTPGVSSARAMTHERARELIGQSAVDLPELRLIEVESSQGSVRIAQTLQAALQRAGFEAEVFGPGPWAEAAAAAARRLARLAIAAAAIAGGAAALIIPLTARARARQERETLLAWMESGATPAQAFGAVARRAAYEGLAAGLLGAGAAAALAFGLLVGAAPSLSLSEQVTALSPVAIGPLGAIALLSGLLAGAGARVAARRLWLEAEGRA